MANGTQALPRSHPTLSMIQFNCGNANGGVNRAILDALDPAVTLIVALQEPGYNRYTKSTYYPKGYHLLYEPVASSRVCFLVSKRLSLEHWAYRSISPDAAVITLITALGSLAVLNVYNDRRSGSSPACLTDITRAAELSPQAQLLVLGDFNLHHPYWGGPLAHADAGAEPLIELAHQMGLHLLTARGSATWKRGTLESTIDLTFATEEIQSRVLRCQPRQDAALAQDHIPIHVDIDLSLPCQLPSLRFQLKDVNHTEFCESLGQYLRGMSTAPIRTTEDIDTRLEDIRSALLSTLERHCPKPRPSPKAKPEWSPECTGLLQDLRRARREYTNTHSHDAATTLSRARNRLKRALRTNSRNSWRLFLEDIRVSDTAAQNKMWKMSRWSRKKAGIPAIDPHQVPPLRQSAQESEFFHDDQMKAQLLAESFFPQPRPIDLSDTLSGSQSPLAFEISQAVSVKDILGILAKLPNKAPGPDRIPNQALRIGREQLAPHLAQVFTAALRLGHFPRLGKHSITLAFRKEGKDDYTIPNSYRPIALENTLAKVYEKVLAVRLTHEVEERNLLPENQMGARRGRSTLTALGHLDETIRTAWKAPGQPSPVTSLLSLDIKGAFPNTSHPRLLYILKQKGVPEWFRMVVEGFLRDRTTELRFGSFVGPVHRVATGLPQGSPLSPILFLLFISELHQSLATGKTRGIAFADDTDILTTSRSIPENCRNLERAHDICINWAKRHGARFAPEKYKLIHFAKSKRVQNLDHPIRIEGFDGKPCDGLRVLGLWIDKGLTYRKHVQRAALSAQQKLHQTTRIVQSTWGLAFQHAKQIYTAVIRPTLAYAAPVWCKNAKGEPPSADLLQPLQRVHNQGVRKILGAYRAASGASLEHESGVPPLDLYLEQLRLERAEKEKSADATDFLQQRRADLWNALKRRRRLPLPRNTFTDPVPRNISDNDSGRPLRSRCLASWKRQWESYRDGKLSTAYRADWGTPPKLYRKLSRAQVSLLTQLRTEAIGFNDFLSRRNVPGVVPMCECSWPRQTPHHVVTHCPLLTGRSAMWAAAGTTDYRTALSTEQGAKAVTDWLLRQCSRTRLPQFSVAKELHQKAPIQGAPLEQWWV